MTKLEHLLGQKEAIIAEAKKREEVNEATKEQCK